MVESCAWRQEWGIERGQLGSLARYTSPVFHHCSPVATDAPAGIYVSRDVTCKWDDKIRRPLSGCGAVCTGNVYVCIKYLSTYYSKKKKRPQVDAAMLRHCIACRARCCPGIRGSLWLFKPSFQTPQRPKSTRAAGDLKFGKHNIARVFAWHRRVDSAQPQAGGRRPCGIAAPPPPSPLPHCCSTSVHPEFNPYRSTGRSGISPALPSHVHNKPPWASQPAAFLLQEH
jgi:hypothetical protein